MRHRLRTIAAILMFAAVTSRAEDRQDFQRVVRPILAEHCLQCHGFDAGARKAQLRLDQFDRAVQPAESGATAIVPFRPDDSELIRRVTSTDADLRMPPADHGKPLIPGQIEILRQWISDGAKYDQHWAFIPPTRPASPPEVRRGGWIRNLIDRHVLSRLEQSDLQPSHEADPARLLRRVSLDLTGLPPTPEELDAFLTLSAESPDAAYEAAVDRLLRSPHFGERMAIDWLDAARYADTNGYFGDKPRQVWPWRDWVIRAFNSNMPFDQFTIEQLAGDLIPEATTDQRVATGFHRNSMANNETGIIDEEYRVEAVADRVDTTATVWLGLTVGCAMCHDHKYDPISQREYYQLFAYFNNSVEKGLVTHDDPPPVLEVPSPEQAAARQTAREQHSVADSEFRGHADSLSTELAAWESVALQQLKFDPPMPVCQVDFDAPLSADQQIGTTLQTEHGIRGNAAKLDATQHVEIMPPLDVDQPWTISVWVRPSGSLGCLWSKIQPAADRRGIELIWQKGRLQLNLVHRWGVDEISMSTRDAVSSGQWHHILVINDGTRKASGLRIVIDGQTADVAVQRDTLSGTLSCDEPLRIGRRDSGLGFYGLLDEFRIIPGTVSPDLADAWCDMERLEGILVCAPKDRTAEEQIVLRDYYIDRLASNDVRDSWTRLQQAIRHRDTAEAAIPSTLIMQDLPEPRPTHILLRGEYDKTGDEVRAGVPSVLNPLPADGPANRLSLAHWLVAPQNPLTARVAVNRMWQMCFGEGLVRTPGDFGTQGELPTHPQLLDELAVRFVDSGWDVKAMLRLIVTSATYRQQSQASAVQLERDPDNHWLSRGPRFRLCAELVRDQALAVSGLLVPEIGGPSARPYQPEGLWEAVSYNAEDTYVPDSGPGLWRRSLYTYRKRQAPPPSLLIFDANPREECLVRRSRTNTPLQALILLNDVTYVEAARALALSILTQHMSDDQRMRLMFRRVVSRWPDSAELHVLTELLTQQRQALTTDSEAIENLLMVGEMTATAVLTEERAELAAWSQVAHVILNLDEVITRR